MSYREAEGVGVITSSHRTAAHTHTRRQIMCKVLGQEQEISSECTMMDEEHRTCQSNALMTMEHVM